MKAARLRALHAAGDFSRVVSSLTALLGAERLIERVAG